MHPFLPLLAAAALLVSTACTTTRAPTTATQLEPAIKAKVDKGIIEPGFTPEMVFLALGKPTEPAESLSDATTNGTWVYRDFRRNERTAVKPGFRSRVVSDPNKKTDVIVNEALDPKAVPAVPARSLHVTFRDGRVVEIKRGADS